MIYFIQENELLRSKIKIGFSDDVSKRFRSLQTQNSVSLKLLLVLHGDRKTESTYHDLFAKYRTHGEWFKAGLWLKIFILKNKFNHIDYDPATEPVTTESKPLTNDTLIVDSVTNGIPLPAFCPDKIIETGDTFSLIKYCDIVRRKPGRPKIKKDWTIINQIVSKLMTESGGKVTQRKIMNVVLRDTGSKVSFTEAKKLKESFQNNP